MAQTRPFLLQQPKLVLLEEPVEKYRFRSNHEMRGICGYLTGPNSSDTQKETFPTVELREYQGRAAIRCALYQTSTVKPSLHCHKLLVRRNDVDISEPHDLFVSPEAGYRAVFQGMRIIKTAKKYMLNELITKKISEKKFDSGRSLTTLEEIQIKRRAQEEAKSMNFNQVKLGFTAYAVNHDGSWTWLCGPIFSRSINNLGYILSGALKICRLSAATGSAAGGDELIILVEQVLKTNIRVKFYEVDENDEEVWENWGLFSEGDVHNQCAITLRTPAYKNKDIDRYVDVFIQLLRPSDEHKSEPVPFRYKPRDSMKSREQARSSSGLSSSGKPEILHKLLDVNLPARFEEQVMTDADELMKHINKDYFDPTETDGSAISID